MMSSGRRVGPVTIAIRTTRCEEGTLLINCSSFAGKLASLVTTATSMIRYEEGKLHVNYSNSSLASLG